VRSLVNNPTRQKGRGVVMVVVVVVVASRIMGSTHSRIAASYVPDDQDEMHLTYISQQGEGGARSK
jgi:hypothetical protein